MNIKNIINTNKTISKELFLNTDNYYEVLPKIKEYIIELGNKLNKENYHEIDKNIWIGKDVKIDKLATIIAPCIIDNETEIRPGAYCIRELPVLKRITFSIPLPKSTPCWASISINSRIPLIPSILSSVPW